MEMKAFHYSGNELDVFATARNWKSYWSSEIQDYIGTNVLEVGAGIGTTAKVLARKAYDRWVGVEPDASLCSVIRQEIAGGRLMPNYTLIEGTIDSIGNLTPFDTALYIDVLEHIENDRRELKFAAAALAPGGRVIIVAPAHNYLFSAFDGKIGHFRRYDKKSIRSIVPAGMEIERLYYLDCVGFFASLTNRFLLHSDNPTLKQVQLWDTVMVRMSRILDRFTLYRFGKTIVCVLRKKPGKSCR